MNFIKQSSLALAVASFTTVPATAVFAADEMDHSQHQMDHSQHQMDSAGHEARGPHAGHTGGHIHHSHKKDGWMFEYRYMGMKMEGLLKGSDSIDPDDVSEARRDLVNNGCGTNPATTAPDGKYCMAPTKMNMDMHMFMAMYGFTDKFSMMAMTHYLKNTMDMVMNMTMPNGMPMMTMTGDMETSGMGDFTLGGMYNLNDNLMLSLNMSLGNASITRTTTMIMRRPDGSLVVNEMLAPYAMQMGSGTRDFTPSVTYKGGDNNMGYGAQLSYTLRTGENDQEYTLGDKMDLTAWGKYRVASNVILSGRFSYLDWDAISGEDKTVKMMGMTKRNITYDAANSGGSRADLGLGISSSAGAHTFSLEYAQPVAQDLNGIQMETDSIISASWQAMF